MHPERKKSVFISGSAYEYGPLGEAGKEFVRKLTRSLIREEFRIISGFGAGVGNLVVESALKEIYARPDNRLTDQLRVFPFPAQNGSAGTPELEQLHRSYRNDMISQAGTAIFLFGNKLEDIAIREADGMWEEFEIARLHGALIIPVGISGYVSATIWKDLVAQYDQYYSDRNLFDSYLRLGDPDAGQTEWIDAILQIAGDEPCGQPPFDRQRNL